MPTRTPILALAGAAALFLGACHSTTKTAPPPSIFGPEQAPSAPISLADARPFLAATSGEASRRFRIIAGDNEGRVRLLQVRSHDSQNIQVRTSIEGEEKAVSVQSFAVSSSGDLVTWRDTNYPHEVFTEFDPPMVSFPAQLSPGGEPVTQSLEFIVHPLADRTKVKQRGKAKVTITLVGTQPIDLPGGRQDAVHVRTQLRVDFGAAKVERTSDEWFVPGFGLVADSFDEQIKVLGVTTEHTSQTCLVDEAPSK